MVSYLDGSLWCQVLFNGPFLVYIPNQGVRGAFFLTSSIVDSPNP